MTYPKDRVSPRHSTRVTLALGVLSFAQSAFAYRTGADTDQFGDTEKVRWAENQVEYQIVEGAPENLNQADVERVVSDALATWSEPACSGLAFRARATTANAAQSQDGVNSVSWVSEGWSDRGWSDSAAGITDLLYERDSTGNWRIVEGDIYLNADGNIWTLEGESTDRRDLLSVVVHEGGHLLGLMHPCEPDGEDSAPDCDSDSKFKNATMYPFYDPAQASLGDDDVAGVCYLYSDNACGEQGCGPSMVCRPEGCVAECGKKVCAAGERCSVEGCRPLGECVGEGCLDCESDLDCANGQSCSLGRYCVGDAQAGDPCSQDVECVGGICGVEGACESLCKSERDCPDGVQCLRGPGAIARCSGSKEGLGSPCQDPTQCVGGVCLRGAAPEPICSRACGPEGAFCPDGWDCEGVEGMAVCTPMSGADDAKISCDIRNGVGNDYRSAKFVGLLALTGTLIFYRKKRPGRASA